MITKIILALALVLPVSAANTDDEIIKNLDFFQSMEILKEEVTFVGHSSGDASETKVTKQDDKTLKAPEKK